MIGDPAALRAAFGGLEVLALLQTFQRGGCGADGSHDVAVTHLRKATFWFGAVLASVLSAPALVLAIICRVAPGVHQVAKLGSGVVGEPCTRGVVVAGIAASLELRVPDDVDQGPVAAVVHVAL